MTRTIFFVVAMLASSVSSAAAPEKKTSKQSISGHLVLEYRYFPDSPLVSEQADQGLSFAILPEFYKKFENINTSFTFAPFARVDRYDKERSHNDIRELMVHTIRPSWELRTGIGKVFWGVTESQHLVDVINQTDAVEATDGEEKLGQPMVNLTLKRPWGSTDLFVLPYFRERTFPGTRGRPRSVPRVDTSLTQYESSRKEKHVDWAARWSRSIKQWDIGLSHFSGTSRDPRFTLGVNASGEPVLAPYYDQINQTGIDVQATFGSWLWKLEAIQRRGQLTPYHAVTAGFEYSRPGIFKTRYDAGFLMEFLYDSRQDPRTAPFERDVLLGTRLGFNDTASSELLAGVIVDTNQSERFYFVEFSRRLGRSYKIALEGRSSSGLQSTSPLYSQRFDDHIQLELYFYF